jgi:hypothetical protein
MDRTATPWRQPIQFVFVASSARRRDTSPSAAVGYHDWTKYTPLQEVYETWLTLPLIVPRRNPLTPPSGSTPRSVPTEDGSYTPFGTLVAISYELTSGL